MISGFCWPQSGVAKDKISLFCRSTETNVRAEVIRQGLKDELDGPLIDSERIRKVKPMVLTNMAVIGISGQSSAFNRIGPRDFI